MELWPYFDQPVAV